MDGIFIFGTPAASVIALGSKEFDVYRLSEALNDKGWNLNTLQFPFGIHICVTHVHTMPGVADRFLQDVEHALAEILKDPHSKVEGRVKQQHRNLKFYKLISFLFWNVVIILYNIFQLAMYGMSQGIPDRTVVGDFTRYFLDAMYYTGDN